MLEMGVRGTGEARLMLLNLVGGTEETAFPFPKNKNPGEICKVVSSSLE